ncbi:protein-tyrosine phosphatase [Bhargavaea ullalensis]|uniref:Protein-tyrosine phosphatase n=2 Tax=Bhargavaea ullalensis TaxID=1265685 RepID=A0ABV2GFZ3_9BACL
MAEAILKGEGIPGVAVRSAGVSAVGGLPPAHHAESLIKENGLPPAGPSAVADEALVDWADLILAMTDSHRRALERSVRLAKGKTFLLNSYVGLGDRDIADPFGGGEEDYRRAFGELNKAVGLLAESLRRNMKQP